MDPICIQTFSQRYEVEMAKDLLEDASIQSFILSDDCGGVYPSLSLGNQGFHLMIKSEDQKRARQVLEELWEE